jgi:hypothetical protein
MGVLSCALKKDKNPLGISNFILNVENEKEVIPDYITLKIHVCGITNKELELNDIFSNKIKDMKEKIKGDKELHMSTLFWIFKLYSKELNETTFNDICNELTKDRDNLGINIKQNAILFFDSNISDDKGESDNINIFLKKIEDIGYVYRPRMIFVTNKKLKFNFRDNRYITNIVCKDYKNRNKVDKNILINKIFSTIWNIDCYFNERLNEIINFDIDNPTNIFKGIENTSSSHSINIFLTGLSRAGKSSFINLVTGKLCALESTDKESVTSKLTEYLITHDDNNDDDKSKDNNFCIKLTDSPGMVFNFNEEFKNKTIVIDAIKKAFEDNSIDKIDIVLFFFSEGSSLENTIDILKILDKKQFTVLFIINRSIDEEENGNNKEVTATKSFLIANKLDNLVKESKFIPCNLKSSSKFMFYGMKEIWDSIYNIFQKENNSMNGDLKKQMKDYVKQFKNIQDKMDINEKESKSKKDNIIKKLSENKLFSKFNEKTILTKCIDMSKKCYNTISRLASLKYEGKIYDIEPTYIFEAIMFLEIGKYYGYISVDINGQFDKLTGKLMEYYSNERNTKNKKKKNKKNKKGEEEKEKKEKEEMEKERTKLEDKKSLIYTKLKIMIENEGIIKSIANKFRKFFDEEEEIIYEKDDNIEIIGNLSQQLFENKLKNENFIPYYLKYFYVYENCFNFIKGISKRKSWENYAPEYIYVNSDDEEEILIKEKNKPNIDSNINENIRTNKKNDKDLNDLQENIQLKDEIININDGQDNEENNKTISNKFIENKDNSIDREQQNKIVENEKNNEEDKISDNINDNEK